MTETKHTTKSRYQEALNAYTKAVQTLHKGQFEESAKLFSVLLDKYATEIELADRARLYIAICAEKKNKTKRIQKSYEDFVTQGTYLMDEGLFAEAMKIFAKAAQMEPKRASAPYLSAINHLLAGDKKESLDSLKNAIELDGKYGVLAQNESDFEPIWEDEDFKAVTEE